MVTIEFRQRGPQAEDPWGLILHCPEPEAPLWECVLCAGHCPAGVALTGAGCDSDPPSPSPLRPHSPVSPQMMGDTTSQRPGSGGACPGPGKARLFLETDGLAEGLTHGRVLRNIPQGAACLSSDVKNSFLRVWRLRRTHSRTPLK